MKANLPELEPKILARWQELGLEKKLLAKKTGKKRFILHDGPPYANGNIHLGHTLNKVLKDIIVKYKTMTGHYAPFVPGWDCHGQPIEHEVEKRLGGRKKEITQAELRKLCREYALNFVTKQKEQFKRLGVTGDWDNPYLTLDPLYESVNVKVFNELYQKGLVYKGKKPIHWCYHCQTALAEAEIEYAEETSPSIFVKFLLLEAPSTVQLKMPLYLVIWTTTPWTLPANVAVAVHPEAEYVLATANGEGYIFAQALLENLQQLLGQELKTLTTFPGKTLLNLNYHHPLFEKQGVVVTAEFVSLEQGSGCVHIAPGHGEEDYHIGLKYKLPTPMPVNDQGVFTDEAEQYAGLTVNEANKVIIADLKKKGLLLASEQVQHSYPHCWRCKNPIIFRATEQWFISLTERGLREAALKAIQEVKWVPQWSINRITGMVKERPDWCISRQRAWGVPIPVFYCQKCGQVLASKEVLERVEQIFAAEGADSWFTKTAAELLSGLDVHCLNCGESQFTKETAILDVWFESGISHAAVLKTRSELAWPADLYLEGSDQHRGWFQSSLLTSVGMSNKPPYKAVLTHGFLVDGQGRKMSKSLGNVVDPLEVIPKAGADILRLWVSSSDYSSDIAVSDEILTRIGESYRRIRNTIRFILGNLYDFNPKLDAVPYADLERVDKWALMRLHQVIQRVGEAYENYRFHQVYHSLYNFCTVDLSAFYLDILKDRLYIYGATAQVRRSAQTVLHQIVVALLKMLAPILVFTADEAWQFLPEAHLYEPSVHLSSMAEFEPAFIDFELENEWEKLLKIRSEVAKALEQARDNRLIGSSLEAKVILYLPDSYFAVATNYQKQLPEIFITSQCLVNNSRDGIPADALRSETVPDLGVKVTKAEGAKCERCWNWRLDVGKSKQHPTICQRCLEAIGIQSFVLEEKEL